MPASSKAGFHDNTNCRLGNTRHSARSTTSYSRPQANCGLRVQPWPTKPLFRLRTRIERIDPTIAAHMPVVVTDLPVALLATTAVLWSYAALSSARVDNILAAGFSLGLTLMAKHSGLVVLACVTTFGVFLLIRLHQCGLFYVQITSYRTAEHDCDLSARAPHLLALACSGTRRMFG